MKVKILGTEYEIITQKESENRKLEGSNGLCEIYSKKIILSEIEDDIRNYDKLNLYKNRVLRHEIIHAFFAESGLRSNSEYAENEELVDWIAIQVPKMLKIFQELNILD